MSNFRPSGRPGFDRGNSRGRFGGGRQGGNFDRNRNSQRPQMHDVTCTKCGNDCQVPFKPTGSKPVLCSDCFRQNDSREGRSNSDSSNNSAQLDKINSKLDKILEVLESLEIVNDEEEIDEERDETGL